MPKNMLRNCLLLFLSISSFSILFAQSIFLTRGFPDVIQDGDALEFAFAGGLNTPQLSAVDLDLNGVDDLYIFDRVGNQHLTFINQGTNDEVDYVFAPSYAAAFPDDITDWVLLRDFNDDGLMDIFTYNDFISSGVRVWYGVEVDGELSFNRMSLSNEIDVLDYPPPSGGASQIYVSAVDYPGVDDVDCDGDLDILTFNIAGGFVEFYQNQSIELGYGRDSLIFELEDNCWGGFFETAISPTLELSDQAGDCADLFQDGDETVGPRHAGSTILTLDGNGDGLKDIILGDIGFTSINRAFNTNSCDLAWITEQDETFPSYDTPVAIDIFPASFYLDVNNDGIRDLLVSPNEDQNAEDYESLWYYENIGQDDNPDFRLRNRTFLIDEMIDLGSHIYPAVLDYNADGLLDLVLGSGSRYQPFGFRDIRIQLYENTGTATNPEFTLVDNDYLNMNQYSEVTWDLAPTFGDLDNDGDVDVLVGERNGQMFYGENTAGPGNPVQFTELVYGYQGIDIAINSAPQIVDFNRDGKVDLIIGERTGFVNYFENIGTAENPLFEPDPTMGNNVEKCGQIDTRIPGFTTGYSTPAVLDFGDRFQILTGTITGQLELYDVIEPFTESFPLAQELTGPADQGDRTSPALADWDSDGLLEMIVGNARGGVAYFNTNITTDGLVNNQNLDSPEEFVDIYPNPVQNQLQVNWEQSGAVQVRIYTVAGQNVKQLSLSGPTFQVDVSSLSQGLYFIELEHETQHVVKRFVKQ